MGLRVGLVEIAWRGISRHVDQDVNDPFFYSLVTENCRLCKTSMFLRMLDCDVMSAYLEHLSRSDNSAIQRSWKTATMY